ncbi:MAG: hypothetical protein A2836_01405 [Candidatus Taylorbacteria bacterium RIFCSPHIGHO2_01_FULL_45_63]|uniref:Uncharacterized protein n=1 Tax=Candidatus Taylorbacteria bacterium RIFCSPHIGHO2_02_FULL_45_35 TaxID=1802311 RepID=A0A1G2MW17_9BACT|nr:MAG: hypothetical protein A2836_01405 [Candidatus Taylorbacteria bacterium RIFCSPHIGHO2_01_FULL_45_63]OHA28068.1 MAG: hypothetical protein A3D56_00110 [Candidatus Taylorbacteria bacterium RIFCSPHIGHO2_02_FULL_45_35]OHA34893.1 MAG: hypothetical protein A3A22_02905 [Candidatus Taylorbacteria bacterium RIFCSPLOWO2_01_FULL_45_34b]
MPFEHPHFNNEGEHTVWVRKAMQIKLAERQYGEEVSSHMVEWIDEHSDEFKKLFDQHIEKDPAFIEHFEKDPDTVLDLIEQEMSSK